MLQLIALEQVLDEIFLECRHLERIKYILRLINFYYTHKYAHLSSFARKMNVLASYPRLRFVTYFNH